MADPVICVAMQPTYLPWLGYLDLIDQSSVFVFLDSVQFSKRSWQQRNRIITHNGLQWLTIPVKVKGKRDQLINQVEIVNSAEFPNAHLRTVEQAYSKSPFFQAYFPGLKELLSSGESLLHKLNINIIRWLARELGIEARFELSSELGVKGKKADLLADICLRVGANVYLSPMGSAEYLIVELQEFDKHNIEILFHNFSHPTYRQVYRPFMSHAAAIDLLFNEGAKSLEIIQSSRRPSFTLEDILWQRCLTKQDGLSTQAACLASEGNLSIRMVRESDVGRLWNWANDDLTRSFSFGSEFIPWNEHLKWFNSVMASPEKCVMILEESSVPVGQIRYEKVAENVAVISYSIERGFRGRGLGTKILEMSFRPARDQLGFTRVEAKVLVNNQPSIRSLQRAGYKKTETEIIAGKESLTLDFEG